MTIFHVDKNFTRIEDITPEILTQSKVRLLLCDLDNTIRLHSDKVPTTSIKKWVKTCQDTGVTVAVVHNNLRHKTMQRFCDPMRIRFYGAAKKPCPTKLIKVMREYGADPSETVLVGDKWTTDVIAANLAHIRIWKVDHRRNLKRA